MWTFAGLLVVAYVLAYWLRKIYRSLQGMGAVHEAALNRAATNRGEAKISDDIDTRAIF
jgi:GDP-D-mannose dehydratase